MPKKELSLFANILSGLIGGGLFVFFLFAFKILVLSIIAGIAGYIISALFLRKERSEINFKLSGIKEEDLKKTVKEGLEKVKEMRLLSLKIKNETVRMKVDEIFDLVEKIFEDFKRDPNDIKASRQFLNYYLDTTIKIIRRYAEISGRNIKGDEVSGILDKTEKLLDTIKIAFEKQLANLMRNDIMDLNVEISVLEKTLKMEGMGE